MVLTKLKEVLNERNISFAHIADKAIMSVRSVENAATSGASKGTCLRIANVLKMPLDKLI